MKISKEDFKKMQAKYAEEIKVGKPAINSKGEKTDQTNWLFFDRETIEGLLEKADKDPKKGGIQFFFAEYTEELAKKYHPKEAEQLTGALTLVMRPATLSENSAFAAKGGEDDDYINNGKICPPFCNPEPTNT